MVETAAPGHGWRLRCLEDGSLVTWGDPEFGGESFAVEDEFAFVQRCFLGFHMLWHIVAMFLDVARVDICVCRPVDMEFRPIRPGHKNAHTKRDGRTCQKVLGTSGDIRCLANFGTFLSFPDAIIQSKGHVGWWLCR